MNALAVPSPALTVFADLLERRTGQRISAGRSWRIEAALRPFLRELDIPNLGVLAERIAARDEALSTRVTEALLNNETSFFRDFNMFELFSQGALSSLAESCAVTRRLRFWSAGCSTGQEAYTLAMMLRDQGARWEGWAFDILATDVSASVIARGRAGRYSQFEIQRGLPVRTMLKWFEQQGEDWVLDPDVRRSVRFATHNLLSPAPGRFDVILCRNVLMYFQAEARAQLFDHLADALDPGGILVMGAGETVIGQTARFKPHPEWRGFYAGVNATDRKPMPSVIDGANHPRA
ncbi:protein-glutamate O-methyltransferase CheR [Sphingomonas paeninsulae]|uniref:Protein-glutamate O-methyltransferase CheR n=1 Tax=Sphingomonas paeninsulae TaxID=2319844 RepID=A0A494TQ13_SPHPE|nr:protein-glutamate O-methyltransferase CheR [Sphingomonas paeninsulae]AYJ87558.1 protein-glutamate O-methyltransferase CheR [Sphingomonas paeninsulae]